MDVLFTDRFSDAAIDLNGNILLRFSKEVSWSYSYDLQDGIYQLMPENNKPKTVISGTYGILRWDSENNAFLIRDGRKRVYYRFNPQGILSQISIEKLGLPSPDGRYRVIRLLPEEWESENDIVKVFSSSTGQELADLGSGWRSKIKWTPSSRSFYFFNCEDGCALYLHQQENAWHSERIARELQSQDGSAQLDDYWLLAP